MNRQCYRLVFNRAKGQLVAASELAAATGKSPSEGDRARRGGRPLPQPAALGLFAALLLGSPLSQASIASDPSAPGNQRPTVLETANGVPQVNIQTPSAAGVSRNSYRQFDVSSKGVILNNSRSNTQTQLSGWVQGNPSLTSGNARVILNEVNSHHPSQLRGHLEVAGSRAEVVIANPAGIDVNGAGFINASRATLTTGTPELRNGELTGYRVQEGTVRIGGAGLDASSTDYTAVLAHAVEVQGGVWANDLNVVAGANRIGDDGQVIERLKPQGEAPEVAIDVAHLGGMYAGKIRLVATEAGVGVNNAGEIAATHAGGVGEVVLTAEGQIVNRGSITAEGDIQLASQTRIDNLGKGAILAQGDLALSATGAQGSIRSSAGTTLAAGVDADSLRLGDSGQLTLNADGSITAQGRNMAASGFLAEADTVSLAGSETQARDIDIAARRGDINASGATLTASDTLTASAGATLRTDDASVQAERLELSAANLSNRDGELVQAGNDTLRLNTGTLDNSGGRVAANADIAIRADALNNAAGAVSAGGSLDVAAQALDNSRGRIEAANGLRLDVADTLTNASGEIIQLNDEAEIQIAAAHLQGGKGLIVSQGDLTLQGDEFVLDGARTQAQRIVLQADSLSHRSGELLHLGDDAPLTLDVTQTLDNSAGLITSNADLALRTSELANRDGTVQAAGGARFTLSELDNRAGEVIAGGSLDVAVQGDVDNAQGRLVAENDLRVSSRRLDNTQGLMGSVQGSLDVVAATLNNTQGRIEAADGLRLDVINTLTNASGEIVQLSDETELLIAATTLQGRDGLIVSQGGLTFNGSDLVLDGARTQAQRIALQAESLSHRGGELLHLGDSAPLILDIAEAVDNTAGLIASNTDLALRTSELANRDGTVQAAGGARFTLSELDNRAGEVIAGGSLDVAVQGDVDNAQGRLIAENDLRVSTSRLDNAQGLMGAVQGSLDVEAEALDNSAGRVEAANGLRLDVADTLTNAAGEIVQLGDGVELLIAATTLQGRDGLIVSQGGLTFNGSDLVLDGARTQAQRIALQAENLSHRDGELLHLGGSAPLTLDIAQALDNSGGLIASNTDLALRTSELTNREGTIQGAGDTVMSVASLDNRQGEIFAGDSLELDSAGTIDNGQGQLVAEGDLDITGTQLINQGGVLGAVQGVLNIEAASLNNSAGRVEAGNGLRLDVADTLTNAAGEIVQLGDDVELLIAATTLQGRDGLIVSQGGLTFNGSDLVLDGARTQAQRIALQAENLSHRDGELLHLGGSAPLTLDIAQALDNSGGLIASNAALDLQTGELTNRGGTVQAAGDVRLTLSELDNRVGEVVAGGTLDLEADGKLENSQGQLLADAIHLAAGSLVNREGLVSAARDGLSISAAELDNVKGRLEAVGDVVLTVEGALINLRGDIMQVGEGELHLSSGSLANTAGFIATNGDLTLKAGSVVNREGTLQAAGDADVKATTLDNRQGELVSGGALGVTVEGDIANDQGQLLAQRALDLRAASLANTGGAIGTVEGDLTLAIEGNINNRNGSLEAGDGLRVTGRELDNQGGTLLGERVMLNTAGRRLDNAAGLIAGRDALDIVSGFLDNTGGTLQASGDITLDTQGQVLINRNNADTGGILANGTLVMRSSQLDNTDGLIGADGLDIEANGVTNRDGTLFSRGGLNLAASELDNRNGEVLALGDLRLALDNALRNQGGLVRALGLLDIAARHLHNGTTLGDEQGLEGGSVSITADEIHNRQGSIRADERLDLASTNGIDNRDGLLSSRHTLDVRTDYLDNQGGTLIANQRLALNLMRLPGSGRLLSLGDLVFQLASDFTLGQGEELKAAGDLQLATTGNLTNRGTLQAGATLDLEAGTIVNAASGELSGTTTQLSAGQLTNRGLIDGVITRIEATALDNLGTGRIYGDWLGIQANALTNQREGGISPVIAARERLDLGVRNLTNRDEALIFSAGDMAIAGRLNAAGNATGEARRIDNRSATIESLGDMSIASDVLNNINDHFETELILVGGGPQVGVFLKPSGWDDLYPMSEFSYRTSCHTICDQISYRHEPTGLNVSSWQEFDLERFEYISRIVQSSPAEIISGGYMEFEGGLLLNQMSRVVAGGALVAKSANIENLEAVGEHKVVDSGMMRGTHSRYVIQDGGASYWETYIGGWRPYSDSSTTTVTLKAGEFGGNRNPTGTGTQISAAQHNVTINGSASGTGTIKPGVGNVNVGGGMIEVPARAPAAITSRSGDLNLVDTSAVGSQARTDRQSTEAQIVERQAGNTVPHQASERTIDRQARADRQSTEAQSVERQAGNTVPDQASERTIDRQARADRQSTEAQSLDPQAMADAGLPRDVIRTLVPQLQLPSNSLFQLKPSGIRPLVETDPRFTNQREWLSSDYLLSALHPDPAMTQKRLGDGFYEQRLIREQVTQLTGQRFLEGYADDEAQYAALMNNAATFAKAHGLRPGVALTTEQMAQLTSDIVWMVEQTVTLADGSTVKVLVPQIYARVREGDLRGDGTLIAGSSLDLNVAGDLVNSGTLAGRQGVTISADRIANLNGRISGGDVSLTATSDLLHRGGDIDGRAVSLFAGRDLSLQGGGVTAERELTLQAGRDLDLTSRAGRQTALTVTGADGLLQASAGRDLTIAGAALDSAGSLALGAGRDLSIASTLDTQSTRYGRVTLNTAGIDHQATLTAGENMILNAGRDLSLAAVDVTAGGNGLIVAGRDLALETLATGSALSGGRLQRSHQQEAGTRLDIGGDLTLLAGQDIYARAAEVSAAGDLGVIAGRNIEIEAGQTSRYDEQRRGRTHTIDSQSRVQGSDFAAGGNLTLSAGEDLRLTASRLQAGENAALLAGGDIEFLTAQEHDYFLYESRRSGGLLGGSRTQRDEVSKSRSISSEVSTGGDLLIGSGQNQTYQAARLDAGGDIALQSGGTIRFETASDMHTESHERSRSSFAWQSASGEGFTRETLRQSELVAQGELIIQAADGLHIDVQEIDRRSVTRTIDAMVTANPDLAWLQEMEQRGDVDWQQVKAFHDSWDYSQSGLGPGAALAVSIVAAAWAGPAASGLINNAVASAMVGAGAGSLAGTGAVSLVNNRGDLGATFSDTFSSDSLRGTATAALTAGATRGMTDQVWGTQTNPTTGATGNLNLSFGPGSDIGRFAGQRATQAAIDAGIRSAVEGGSYRGHLGDSLENAVTHVVSGVLFNAVGDLAFDKNWDEGGPQKIALHALVGGSVAEAMGGDFRTGALAAGASEALVHHLVENGRANPVLSNTIAQLVGIVAAELSGGDVNDGALIAGQVESYNRQLHTRERELLAEQAVALEERLGSPQLQDTTWEDMLLLVSGAALDEQEAQRFMALLDHLESSSNDNNPLYQRFLQDLQTASTALQDLSSRYAGQALTWANGEPITAHGEPVTAFQATEAQYRDSGLFGQVDAGAFGLGGLGLFPQYGAGQASQHYGEIAGIGASASPLDALYDRMYWNALGGGAIPDTADVDVALALTGAGAGIKALSQGLRSSLQARVYSGATSRASHELYKNKLRASMEKPVVQDARLSSIVDNLYRPNARVGSGSTADAVRQEILTGQPVGGKFHTQKAQDSIASLERWLVNNPAARPGDRAAAESIIIDLSNALRGR